MINFKSIEWRNFLSTGNAPTKIDFQKTPTTLIIGQNGAGKSTILDALTFCLFGRAFRKINKPQLVNSVNEKKTLVEVEFSIGKNEFVVKRGIKPGIFEIWRNGNMIDQDAKAKDLQDQLEKQILKLNFKTFTQVVILGSSTFVPFMQLSNNDRREIIENILDIQVFSTMNIILKQKMSALRTQMDNVDNQVELYKEKIEIQESHMKRNSETKKEQIADHMKTIKESHAEIDRLMKENTGYTKQIESLMKECDGEKSLKSKRRKLSDIRSKIEQKISHVESTLNFFNENSECPTCKQSIEVSHKEGIVVESNASIEKFNQGIHDMSEEFDKLDAEIEKIEEKRDEERDLSSLVIKNMSNIESVNNYINKVSDMIEDLNEKSFDDVDNEKLDDFKKKLVAFDKDKKKMIDTKHYLDLASLMLKDSGIKTKIVKKYLPHMNKLINKYLTAMDFYVQFTLDENFNETIKSRHRDVFSYSSFSEGEKMRIDLALLFSWRAIAKMKSSVNTNLLILDEVFDSSLDTTGVDEFMKLLNEVSGDASVFVISHRGDVLMDKFHSTLVFKKEGNFSKVDSD